jgi:hypothetical protein
MKPAKIYNCETCRDAGYVHSASGALEPCPNCVWGAAAVAQSRPWNEPRAGQPETACAVVKFDPDKQRTPAQVGRALKIILYVGMVAAVWTLDHYFGGKATAEGRDVLEGSDTTGPAAANDFSPWEPEP